MSSVKITSRNLARKTVPCELMNKDGTNCDGTAHIHNYQHTKFTDLGSGPGSDRSILHVRYGGYYCQNCKKYFTQKLPEGTYGTGYSNFTKRVHDKAVELVLEDKRTQVEVVKYMHKHYGADIPLTTLSDWVRRRKTK